MHLCAKVLCLLLANPRAHTDAHMLQAATAHIKQKVCFSRCNKSGHPCAQAI